MELDPTTIPQPQQFTITTSHPWLRHRYYVMEHLGPFFEEHGLNVAEIHQVTVDNSSGKMTVTYTKPGYSSLTTAHLMKRPFPWPNEIRESKSGSNGQGQIGEKGLWLPPSTT